MQQESGLRVMVLYVLCLMRIYQLLLQLKRHRCIFGKPDPVLGAALGNGAQGGWNTCSSSASGTRAFIFW